MPFKLSQIQRSRGRGFGGSSPYVEGLLLEDYQRLVPGLKMEYRDPSELKFTDQGNDLNKIIDISETWSKAVIRGVETGKFEQPNICPVVVADVDDTFNGEYFGLHGVILDGNSRTAVAYLHTHRMPVIIVENPDDLALVKKLHKTGKFYWAHGGRGGKRDFNELMRVAKEAEEASDTGDSKFIYDIIDTTPIFELPNEGEGVYFNPNIFGESSLEYCIGRVAFKEDLGKPEIRYYAVLPAREFDENDPDLEFYDKSEIEEMRMKSRRNLREEIEKHSLKERIKNIVLSSGLRDVNLEEFIEGTIEFLKC